MNFPPNAIILFFCMIQLKYIVHMHIFFTQSFGYVDLFHILAITNCAALNTNVVVSADFSSLTIYQGVEWLDHMEISFSFLRDLHSFPECLY